MASRKQIEANRLNARKSTGPRTTEGKARSSMNALKSGIDAKSQVIRREFQANLEALQAEYYDRFHPTTPEQRMLVDTLIDCEWLLRRFRLCEAQLWEQGAQDSHPPLYETALARSFRQNAECLSRLQRRIDTTQRNYRNALHELERLQAEEELSVPELATVSNETATPQNGFVPHSPLQPLAPKPPAPVPPVDPPPTPGALG